MARSPCGEKKQRILFTNRVRLLHFPEQIIGIGELRLELLAHFRTHFITASLDAGSDCRLYVPRQRAKVAPHLSHSFFNDALDRAPPARMKHSDSFLLCIYENHRQAIGSLDGEQNAGHARDEAISN